ncbi:MAG: PHP domain-containing protein [Anaerolineae bacterium]|nr:PHP domain-containing protein [Anaerolineae bacterium]
MIPPLIVDEALYKGLNLIAITDHNATANVTAVIAAAQDTELIVLPGMELQTREEVDVLCLFDTPEQAALWQTQVDAWMLPLQNDATRFGPQFVVDAEGEFVREETRMLQAPTKMNLENAARAVHALGGLVIPAHIDRPSKGLLQVLGLWPPDLEADAAEVSPNIRPSQARARYPFLPEIPLITSSDAHFLEGIGQVMSIFILDAPPSITELWRALQGIKGRRFYVP